MKKLNSVQIRKMFLDFFKSKGHKIEPSHSLIPDNDPSLLWINSGVATLKKYFNVSVVPENPRITSAQKSIRTNDIENVGHTARHHTFFEMLGNFSVGDYFKREAIKWAWELLTNDKWFDINPKKLYITYYPRDKETEKFWLAQPGFVKGHAISQDDNFWDIGEGPSGPDTEIFFDRGKKFQNLSDDNPEMYPGGENGRYLEMWNIVFSQFNHLPGLTDNTQYPELPHKNIDTGMGLERVVSIFENAPTNFETDLFLPIINQVEKISNKSYGKNKKDDVNFKIIADHIRAVTFAISDGAFPGNTGRGYVIRRLIRRAVMHGRELGIEELFLFKLVPTVGKIMQAYYPEILKNKDKISKVIKEEETRFNKTLTSGLTLLNKLIKNAKDNNQKEISGKDAFKLFDTYGFPFELTREQVLNADLKVSKNGFSAEMKRQQQRARKAQGKIKTFGAQNGALMSLKAPSKYVGWTKDQVKKAKVVAMIANNKLINVAHPKQRALLVFDKTPFYAEMGGQVADKGQVLSLDDQEILAGINDVQSGPNKQHIHNASIYKSIRIGEQVNLKINKKRHQEISKNHTATHLLDQALRNILGNGVHQAGSLVEPHFLRFDFTHQGPVDKNTLNKIEKQINEQIFKSLPITWFETDINSAKKMGAIAVFNQKYGKKVRIVSIDDYNKEFDGGTHAKNTSELGIFRITNEIGIGSGIRRIQGVTGVDALRFINEHENILKSAANLLNIQDVNKLNNKVSEVIKENRANKKKIESLSSQLANQEFSKVLNKVKKVGNVSYITAIIKNQNMTSLREIVDNWRNKRASDLIILASSNNKKPIIVAASIKPNNLKANNLIKAIAKEIQGGGGGRPDLAQAGGKNSLGIKKALDLVPNYIRNHFLDVSNKVK